jgi:hypothetical protein
MADAPLALLAERVIQLVHNLDAKMLAGTPPTAWEDETITRIRAILFDPPDKDWSPADLDDIARLVGVPD